MPTVINFSNSLFSSPADHGVDSGGSSPALPARGGHGQAQPERDQAGTRSTQQDDHGEIERRQSSSISQLCLGTGATTREASDWPLSSATSFCSTV